MNNKYNIFTFVFILLAMVSRATAFDAIPLEDLSSFQPVAKNWKIVGAVEADLSGDGLMTGSPGTGILLCQPTQAKRDELFTRFAHADIELECEVMVPIKSNSGIYFQGRYEVQILDSWGNEEPKHSDIGGIYQRWDPSKSPQERGYEGHPPMVNAARKAGEWQQFKIKFRAPRFNAKGNKIQNARFDEVWLNGQLVQKDVEVSGPTRSAALEDEVPFGPVMIQGDHGPVAIRNIKYRGDIRDSIEYKVLIVTGQNNHGWETSSPIIEQIYDKSPLFEADILTSPARAQDMSCFSPKFEDYDLVCLDYNGDAWPQETKAAFENYVRSGGAVTVFHAADNSFPDWNAFNEMIGLGGWGGRDESDGPFIYWQDGELVRDMSPGRGGKHGQQVEYVVVTREPEHPIMKGLPTEWLHVQDELYSLLRGPAKNLTVLATAMQDTATGGTGRNEPVLMTIDYGKGRIFHTVMGHAGANYYDPVRCRGFITTLLRGSEWAITGEVSQRVPPGFPKPDSISIDTNYKPRPEVLIIGDSISMGYIEYVAGLLNGEADVTHPKNEDGNYTNCEGTTKGVLELDNWLAVADFDVITFNFGLHDLKHIIPGSVNKNSTNPDHPQQADLATYRANLEIIADKLLAYGAELVFVTTTPYPDKPGGPLRRADQPAKYNKAALEIMENKGIPVLDLFKFVEPRMEQLLLPNNVHFTPDGSRELGDRVANSIRQAAAKAGW